MEEGERLMKRKWRRSFLSVVLVLSLVTGSVAVPPSAIAVQAKGQHGTAAEPVTKKELKDTPPSPEEYDVNMSMQREAREGAYNAYFLKDDIQTVRISLNEKNLNYLLQNAGDKPTVMTDQVVIGGQSTYYTGLKTKGNYTLAETDRSDSDRFSFTVNFGKYIKKKKGYAATQNFYGCNKISFNNFFFDKTMMKEYLALKLMSEMGVPTPQYGLAKVYINDAYYGVYFMLEAMDGSILEQYLSVSSDGISDYLTKPEGTRLQFGEGLSAYKDAGGDFTMDSLGEVLYKNEEGDYEVDEASALADQSGLWESDADTLGDVAEMLPVVLTWEEKLNLLSNGKDFSGNAIDVNSHEYMQLLAQIMDVDEAVRYFAVHSFIIQMDNMFNKEQNFGLYVDKSGKSMILPWDYDLGWGCFFTPYDAESVANWDLDKMFTPDLVQGTADTVYRDFPLFHVIYQNSSLMARYHQYMMDCSIITTLGGKTSSGSAYEAGRFAAAVDKLMPALRAAASEKLADHVYYMDHEKQYDAYRQCQQPAALLAGLPNLSRVAARRAVGVYKQLEGIRTTVAGYGCDMSTIGNAGPGRPSTGGNLAIVDERTGIFATAQYAQDQWAGIGPSLAVTELGVNDPVYLAVRKRAGEEADILVYRMMDTRTPVSPYRVYVPVSLNLQPGGGRETHLYSYSDAQDVLVPLSGEKISGSVYSAETSVLRYIAVVKKSSTKGASAEEMPGSTVKPQETIRKPGQVKSLKTKNVKGKKVKLSWRKVSGAKGYQIQYSQKKKFPAAKSKKKNAVKRTVTISRLKKKKTYYFRVRAYKKKANGTRVYGKWSKVGKAKIRK